MSTLNVDKVDPSTGTTLELGTSGDTVNLGSGVTAGTGFGGDLSFGGDTFGADKTIGSNDTYALSFETDGNVAMKIDTAGIITKPLQPAFNVNPSASQTFSVGSRTTISFDTERFDTNADFNTSNYTFTAPVTGRYFLTAEIRFFNVDVSADYYEINLVTSNKLYYFSLFDPDGLDSDVAYWSLNGGILADMDAGDTCTVGVYQEQGAEQTYSAATDTYWSGHLVC